MPDPSPSPMPSPPVNSTSPADQKPPKQINIGIPMKEGDAGAFVLLPPVATGGNFGVVNSLALSITQSLSGKNVITEGDVFNLQAQLGAILAVPSTQSSSSTSTSTSSAKGKKGAKSATASASTSTAPSLSTAESLYVYYGFSNGLNVHIKLDPTSVTYQFGFAASRSHNALQFDASFSQSLPGTKPATTGTINAIIPFADRAKTNP